MALMMSLREQTRQPMPGPRIEVFPAQSFPHPPPHCGCLRRDRQKKIFGLSECDACRRHSPPPFALNGASARPSRKAA